MVKIKFYGRELSEEVFNIDILNKFPNPKAFMSQIHSDKVSLVSKDNSFKLLEATDGILTKDSHFLLIGTFADCIPIYFYDANQKYVGLCHSGWKGSKLNIVSRMIDKIVEEGFNLKDLRVHMGPSISWENYEVKEDFLENFQNSYFIFKDDKIFFDNRKLCYNQLIEYIDSSQITFDNRCTFSDLNLHSYRRDGLLSGRNIATICIE